MSPRGESTAGANQHNMYERYMAEHVSVKVCIGLQTEWIVQPDSDKAHTFKSILVR